MNILVNVESLGYTSNIGCILIFLKRIFSSTVQPRDLRTTQSQQFGKKNDLDEGPDLLGRHFQSRRN